MEAWLEPHAPRPLWWTLREAGSSPSDVLRQFGAARPPVDIERLVAGLGISIESSGQLLAGRPVGPLQRDAEAPCTAAFASTDAVASGWIGARLERAVARFYQAHLVGHLLLHPLGTYRCGSDPAASLRYPIAHVEAEANRFAAHLLAPDGLLDPLAVSLDPTELAALFGVPPPVMARRLRELVGSPVSWDP